MEAQDYQVPRVGAARVIVKAVTIAQTFPAVTLRYPRKTGLPTSMATTLPAMLQSLIAVSQRLIVPALVPPTLIAPAALLIATTAFAHQQNPVWLTRPVQARFLIAITAFARQQNPVTLTAIASKVFHIAT